MKPRLSAFLVASVGLLVSDTPAWACATCFGASDAPMAHGMNMGIFTLLVVIASVLCGIAACFIALAIRTKRQTSPNRALDPNLDLAPRGTTARWTRAWEAGMALRR